MGFKIHLYICFCCFLIFVFWGAKDSAVSASSAITNDSSPAILSQIRVIIKDGRTKEAYREAYYKKMVKHLIFLREGRVFTAKKLQTSIEALKASRQFHTIQTESQTGPQGLILTFTLTPFRRIKDISIQGNYPLFKHEVLDVMTIYAGDGYVKEVLLQQAGLISGRYLQEGYFAPQVSVKAKQDPKDGNYNVYIKIKKGSHLALKKLETKGNRAFSTAALKRKMSVWRSSLVGAYGRFSELRLKRDIKRLIAFYRKKHYPDVTISHEITPSPSEKYLSVSLSINEGDRYDISFKGNHKFWAMTLKKDLTLFKSGNRNDRGIKKSIKNIKARYRQAGYLSTGIRLDEKIDDGEIDKKQPGVRRIGVRHVCFLIEEGPCSVVASVKVDGNKQLDKKIITAQILTKTPSLLHKGIFVPKILDKDLFSIKSLYLEHGFLKARIQKEIKFSEDKKKVFIRIRIDEGVKTLISSLKITGLSAVSTKEALAVPDLKQGSPFRKYMLKNDEKALMALVSEKGYPHVKVKSQVMFSSDNSSVEVQYQVIEGRPVNFGELFISGNLRTRDKVIRKEFKIAPGETFSLKKVHEGLRLIRNMDIFNSVQFQTIGLKENADEVSLCVAVEERKPFFYELAGGYESDRGWFGRTKIGDHNLLGLNKDGWVAGEASEIGYRVGTGITDPRFLGSRIRSDLGIFIDQKEEFNQNFGTRTFGTALDFSLRMYKHFHTGLNFRFENRNQYATGQNIEKGDAFDPRSILVITPLIRYDSRDSFIRPRQGILANFMLDVSKGIQNSMDDFLKYRLDLRFYKAVHERVTLAWTGRIGHIDPFKADSNIPDDQLFFLGGTTTIRGFDENMLYYDNHDNPLGGRTAIMTSLEARIDIGFHFELTTFFDIGKLQDIKNRNHFDGFRSSVGWGLRYITPIGPIGFLYGYKLNPKTGEDASRVHFSIGYTF
ncbi:MAG: outer membrane protein assembly factor BamA [Desulfosarcina sp.]|nr:outer membrane protein assembly factor BamA [Desulfobacterales bacterium]